MDTRELDLLEKLLRVNAATLVAGKNLSEGAPLLERLGVERPAVAAIYDTSESSVRSVLSKANKPSSEKGQKRRVGPR